MPETYLNSPKTKPVIPPAKPLHLTPIIIAAIAAGTIISISDIIRKPPSRPVEISRPPPIVAEAVPSRPATVIPLPIATPAPAPLAPPEPLVLRAQPVEPIVRRGLPVEGQLYLVRMPDGTMPLIRYMGVVRDFGDLPKHPNLYELYRVAQSGHAWVFMQPAGFSAPAWVDP
jgi:hypothetical protein